MAEGQQPPFQGQLRGATRCFLGMGEGSGPAVEFQDGVSPLGQWRIIRVEGAQVVDVPQQVGPAPLLGAIVIVVSGVEIADQYSGESIAQRLVYDAPGPRLFCPDPAAGSSVRRK